jgi:ABC-2 type transport system ATP-binding protein
LKKQVGGERLEITVEPADLETTNAIVAKISGHATHIDLRTVSAPVLHGSKDLMDALRAMDDAKIHPLDIGLKRPSLDDVFLSLTGHVAEEAVEEPLAKKKRGARK